MYFGQKIHPLNFAYCEHVRASDADAALEFASDAGVVRMSAFDLGGLGIKLAFDNSHVSDKTNYSDGVAPEHRATGRALRATEISSLEASGFLWANDALRIVANDAGLSIQFTAGGELTAPAAGGVSSPAATTYKGDPAARIPLRGLGVNGRQTILNLTFGRARAAYGCGERTGRLNKLGKCFDHWTVDVVDVHKHHWQTDDYDPAYVAIPFVILQFAGGAHCGLFFDNPERVLLDLGKRLQGTLMYQSLGANTDLYLLPGPTLRDVTRRFSTLTGRGALPALWALGHHQCRWGYGCEADFRQLQSRFREHDIPVSAFWYDIDYMDAYRVFTWNRTAFPDPARLNQDLKADGIHTVAIVDPGVKRDPGYAVYDSGKARAVFCQTESGRDYIGQVWPGDTLFPDFTLEKTRQWWAEQLADWMRASALDGAWLDMNDPATGESRAEEMRFDHGRLPHAKYHNQYAHFMARASRRGCDALDPEGRPFLLTRSASTGSQRHTAVWTGDNASNWQHLRMSIPCTLNLGLSGIAFNGPDVGGFMGNTTAELLTRWYQAGFLFPFFRNHSCQGTAAQEPWIFGPVVRERIAAVIRTRYRLLPYLYQCFFEHWLHGDPVLRPIFYHEENAGAGATGLENVDDEFLVGDALLHAPMLQSVEENRPIQRADDSRECQVRTILLPPGWWYDLNLGQWTEGGRGFAYAVAHDETPLFARDGAIVPYFNGPLRTALTDFRAALELHIFSKEKPAHRTFYLDDQQTRAYQRGAYNTLEIHAGFVGENDAFLEIHEQGSLPIGSVSFSPVFYGRENSELQVRRDDSRNEHLRVTTSTRRWLARELPVLV